MNKYEKEIENESENYSLKKQEELSHRDSHFMACGFIDGVNSEIAAKIREDEAVEFAEYIRSNGWKSQGIESSSWVKSERRCGCIEYFYITTKNLYRDFLTQKSK